MDDPCNMQKLKAKIKDCIRNLERAFTEDDATLLTAYQRNTECQSTRIPYQ